MSAALNKILSAKDQGKVSTAEVEDEATWFMKICKYKMDI